MLYIDFYAHSSVLYKRLLSYDKYLYFTPAKSIFFFFVLRSRAIPILLYKISGFPPSPTLLQAKKFKIRTFQKIRYICHIYIYQT